jgi:hypothetical protein
MTGFIKIHGRKIHGERGISLVEAAMAIAILGTVIVAMILSMSGGVMAVQDDGQMVTAQSLARTQLEYIKNCTYEADAATYPTVSVPDGYSITVAVNKVPDTSTDIQKVTVNILRSSSIIFTISDYKVKR